MELAGKQFLDLRFKQKICKSHNWNPCRFACRRTVEFPLKQEQKMESSKKLFEMESIHTERHFQHISHKNVGWAFPLSSSFLLLLPFANLALVGEGFPHLHFSSLIILQEIVFTLGSHTRAQRKDTHKHTYTTQSRAVLWALVAKADEPLCSSCSSCQFIKPEFQRNTRE